MTAEGLPGFKCLHGSCQGKNFEALCQFLSKTHPELANHGIRPHQKRKQEISLPTTPRRREEETGSSAPTFPQIKVNDRQLRNLRDDALSALAASNAPPTIFVRGGNLVTTTADENGRRVISELNPITVRHYLTDCADFYRSARTGLVNCDPPMQLAEEIIVTPVDPTAFPPLDGIIDAPSIRPDGKLITTAGYDPRSRLLFEPNPQLILPPLLDRPTSSPPVQ
jgi:hypothetical protein